LSGFSENEWIAWERLYQTDSVNQLARVLFAAAKRLVPCKAAALVLRPTEYELPCHISDPKFQWLAKEYVEDIHKVDIWLQRSPIGPHIKAVRHSDYTPLWMLKRSPFYRRCLSSLGTCYGASITAWKEGVWLAVLTFLRSEKEGDFSDGDMDCLKRWQPHFARVVHRLSDRQEQVLYSRSLEAFMWSLPTALIVLDWRLQTLNYNVAAVDLCHAWRHGRNATALKHAGSFQVPKDILQAVQRLKPEILAARTNVPTSRNLFPLKTYRHPSWSGLEAGIQFAPSKSLSVSKGTFLVNVRHAKSQEAPAYDRIRKLTRRERECAKHAAEGKTSPQIARALGISGKTVRHHLSATYAKLGFRQRHELIAFVANLPAGIFTASGLMIPGISF
jgi:DNA-binding CsgD family transcriptional regulator